MVNVCNEIARLQVAQFFQRNRLRALISFFAFVLIIPVKNLVICITSESLLIVTETFAQRAVYGNKRCRLVDIVQNGENPFNLFVGVGEDKVRYTLFDIFLKIVNQ